MTPKQERFCEEYLIDLNATQAAIRAGYSVDTAKEIGCQNLTKVNIQEKIQSLRKQLSENTQITSEMVIAELAKIGFSNVQDFVNGGNSILELKHLERHKVAAVSAVETIIKEDGTILSKIKFHDKVTALEKLGRHLGIFEKDNEQLKPTTSVIIPDKMKVSIDKILDESI